MSNGQPKKGAHIKVKRFMYSHHGVYVGNGWVIHLTGDLTSARVQKDSLKTFCNGAKWSAVEHADGCSPEKAVRRAEQSIGYEEYNLLKNNCEHFARWCTTNDARSLQVAIPGLSKGRREGNGKGYRRHER